MIPAWSFMDCGVLTGIAGIAMVYLSWDRKRWTRAVAWGVIYAVVAVLVYYGVIYSVFGWV